MLFLNQIEYKPHLFTIIRIICFYMATICVFQFGNDTLVHECIHLEICLRALLEVVIHLSFLDFLSTSMILCLFAKAHYREQDKHVF